jgi:WD40-like Beta Propeller Repeat
MRSFFRIVSAVGFSFVLFQAQGQQAREIFGKNRIQYKNFEWKYLSSENFDVYYYEDRRKVAGEALQYLESEFDRITDLIGWPPYLKTKVFLYNSVTDLQQSNVGLNHTQFNVGGETEFIKPYVEIAHPGTLEEFKEELIYKVSDLLVHEMMFGGSVKEAFQNSVLLNIPDWFVEGASLYVSKGWNMEMDDYVRQLVRSKKVNNALKQTGKDSQIVGQSIWNYMVEKYGKSSISNILNYTRVIRSEQKSILITLGIPFKQLLFDWQQYYSQIEKRVDESYVSPADSNKFSPPHHKATVYTTVKISPDGKKIAYAENYRGKFVVKVTSLENGHETTILNGGNKVIKQAVDLRVPLLSWADQNTLGVIGIKNGEFIFWLYDLNSRTKLPRKLNKFSNIRSLDFSSNGRLAVISADQLGQNDLYLVSTRRDRIQRLTNDLFDDLDPSFVPNSNTILFSSNRTTDTIQSAKSPSLQKLTANFNLFSFNLDTTTNVATRVTNTLSMDYLPRAQDIDNIFYLSDQRGIVNLFKFNRPTGIYTQVTNFNSSIKDYDLDFTNKKLSMVMTKNLKEDIFVFNNFNLERQIFTPPTRRREVQQAKVVSEKRKKEAANKVMSIKQLINSRLQEKKDTTTQLKPPPQKVVPLIKDTTQVKSNKGEINTDDYTFDEPVTKSQVTPTPVTKAPVTPTSVPSKKDDKTVNTEDYSFADEALKEKQPSETFLNRYMKARSTNRTTGPFPYEPKFTYENLITNLVIDPLRSYSVRLETQMNDILENYRFFGGLQTAFDLKSGDVYAEAQYLKHRVDFSARLDRKVIFWDQADLPSSVVGYQQKYSFQKVEVGASLPLSVRTRFTVKPFAGYTQFVDRGPNDILTTNPPTFYPTKEQFYVGSKAELVYDNSLTTGANIIEGTRGKINFVTYGGVGNPKAGFSQLSLDLRHYQRIYHEIIFAVRGYTGSFFGAAPKKYVLGGMDNWFGYKINYDGVGNPLASSAGAYNQNLLFTEFVTSLRGFNYATLYGSSVALANAELRIPLVRALTSGPIASNFFRNMMFTAFYDIGSSWTGPIPFNSKAGPRTRIVPDGSAGAEKSPFLITLNEYINPWIYSYGCGFRTVILGYYVKCDVAWPVQNYKVQSPRAFVTLGYDF